MKPVERRNWKFLGQLSGKHEFRNWKCLIIAFIVVVIASLILQVCIHWIDETCRWFNYPGKRDAAPNNHTMARLNQWPSEGDERRSVCKLCRDDINDHSSGVRSQDAALGGRVSCY